MHRGPDQARTAACSLREQQLLHLSKSRKISQLQQTAGQLQPSEGFCSDDRRLITTCWT